MIKLKHIWNTMCSTSPTSLKNGTFNYSNSASWAEPTNKPLSLFQLRSPKFIGLHQSHQVVITHQWLQPSTSNHHNSSSKQLSTKTIMILKVKDLFSSGRNLEHLLHQTSDQYLQHNLRSETWKDTYTSLSSKPSWLTPRKSPNNFQYINAEQERKLEYITNMLEWPENFIQVGLSLTCPKPLTPSKGNLFAYHSQWKSSQSTS